MAPVALSSVYSFVAGFVQTRDILRVLAQSDELNADQVPNTTLLKVLPSQGQKLSFHLLWTATKVVVTGNQPAELIVAGPDGKVDVGTPGGDFQEKIGSPTEGPSVNGLIRDLRLIGDAVFAAGMGRQVYQRVARASWVPLHGGVLQAADLREVRGFNAIHGRDPSELVAVGWHGEIYRRRGAAWHIEDSGTNAILNDVHVIPNGTAFAGGQGGILIRNSGPGWQILDQGEIEDEIRTLQWFGDRLFIATDDQLFAMDSRDRLSVVKVTPSGSTFDSLHAQDGVLLSVGPKDIWWTKDAKKWQRIE